MMNRTPDFSWYRSSLSCLLLFVRSTIFPAELLLLIDVLIGVNVLDHIVLARMIHFFVPTKKLWDIRPSLPTFLFVSLDIASFFVQLIGCGIASTNSSQEEAMRGIHIYMGGIGLQELFVIIFLALAVKFHIEMLKAEKGSLLAGPKTRWRQLLFALYASLIAITVRIIFRLVEFSAGNTESNPLPNREAYFYVFDGIPMFIAIMIWNLAHPGATLQGPESQLPRTMWIRKLCRCCCSDRERKRDKGADEDLTVLRLRRSSPSREMVELNKFDELSAS
jgi:hypothetical protein